MRFKPARLAAAFATLAILNAAAQPQPVAKPKIDPRVQTLATDGEAVIDVAVQRGQLTHLVLPAGETFTLPPATGQGARCDYETHAWCIVAQGRDLFIKAKPSAKTNNLILVTERRRFAIDLRAVDRGGLMRLTLMPPKGSEASSGIAPPEAAAQPKAIRIATPAPDPQKLLQERLAAAPIPRNAQYSMAVGKASEDITPSMVFDDGRFTYLKFPGNRPLPAIFQTAPDGSEETVNVRMGEDDLLIADRVARKLVLRLGQSVVVVVNDAFDLEGQAPVDGTTVPGVTRTLTQGPKAAAKPVPAAMPVRVQAASTHAVAAKAVAVNAAAAKTVAATPAPASPSAAVGTPDAPPETSTQASTKAPLNPPEELVTSAAGDAR